MKWQAPSQRTQFILLSPIIVPAGLLLAAMILPAVPFILLAAKLAEHRRAKGWHRWFAWYPVRFDGFFYDRPSCWFWLETVERCLWSGNWSYRPLGFDARHHLLTEKRDW